MSEIQLTINVVAPELADALKALATALAGRSDKMVAQEVQKPVEGVKTPKKDTAKAKTEVKTEAKTEEKAESVKDEALANAVSAEAPEAAKDESKVYTMADLAEAGASLINTGKQSALKTLLQSYGVKALPALPKDRYGDFAEGLRALGAKI